MNRKRRRIGITVLVLVLLIGLPIWFVRDWKQMRQDHALIQAIKAENSPGVLKALTEGAGGDARDTGPPPTFREALLHLLDRVRHPGQEEVTPLSALVLLYQITYDPTLPTGPGPDIALVRALLDHGAVINDRNVEGKTPLFYAAQFGNCDTVRLLLARGADIESKDLSGYTPLMWADTEVTKVLLEHKINIDARDKYEATALMWAASSGNPDKIRLLLECGASIDAVNQDKQTALMWAVKYGTPDAVRVLLDHGAKIESVDNDGDTALLVAVKDGRIDSNTTRLLLEHGAKANKKSADGLTALSYMLRGGKTESDFESDVWEKIILLRKYGAK